MASKNVSITSTTAVLAVDKAKRNWQELLIDAYAAVISDREAGASDTAISRSWKAAGITPNGNDTIGAYARTATITTRLADFERVALWAVIAETHAGASREPHAIVLTACQVRGVDYVDAALASFAESVDALGEDDREAGLSAALGKLVRALIAKPRAAKTDDGSKGSTGDEGNGNGDEGNDGDEETTGDETTPTSRLSGLLANLGRVVADWEREGHAPNAETVEAFLVLARRVNTLKRDRAADMAAAV
jgi:hypothetical protein